MTTTRLLLIKHSEARAEENQYFCLPDTLPLCESGHQKAQRLAQSLEKTAIDALYSSSALEAIETAKYISHAKNIPVIATNELKELYGGEWHELPWNEIKANWPDEYQTFLHKAFALSLPDGETMQEFQNRILGKVRGIVNQNIGKTICIILHEYGLNLLLSYFKGVDYQKLSLLSNYGYSSISVVDIEQGTFKILTEGNVSHLTS